MGVMPEGGCHGKDEWIAGEVTDRCPVMYTMECDRIFQAYVWAKRGFLPNEWMSQPAGLLHGIDVVWQAVEEEELRRSKAQANA